MAFTLNYTGNRITDALAGALTGADLAAYNAAATDALVPISAAGFASLAAISGASVAGMPTSQITTGVLSGATPGNMLWQNTVTAATNSPYTSGYVYAFRIVADQTKVVSPGMQIGYSTTATGTGGTAFAISNICTTATTTDNLLTSLGYAYYVIKRPSVLVPASSYPRVYLGPLPAGNNYSYKTASAGSSNYSGGTSITGVTNATIGMHLAFQMLQLPSKQW